MINGEKARANDAKYWKSRLEFIECNGDSRFSELGNAYSVFRDRAGWWRGHGDDREYLFTGAGLKEAIKGYDFKRALDTLQKAGVLPDADSEGKRARQTSW